MGTLPPNMRLKISRVADQTEWELRKFKKILKNAKLKYDELLTAVVGVECVPRNPYAFPSFDRKDTSVHP